MVFFFSYMPSFLNCLVSSVCLSRESCVWPKLKARCMTHTQSKHETYAHTLVWHAHRVKGNFSRESRAGWWRESRWQHGGKTDTPTGTHLLWKKNVWSQFCTLQRRHNFHRTVYVCVNLTVCARACVMVVFILAVAAMRRVQKFRKGGFPLVPLHQQQLFGTFNIY